MDLWHLVRIYSDSTCISTARCARVRATNVSSAVPTVDTLTQVVYRGGILRGEE